MSVSRRTFLGGVAAGAALAATSSVVPTIARADGNNRRILEIFCPGAMDPRFALLGNCASETVSAGPPAWSHIAASAAGAYTNPFASGHARPSSPISSAPGVQAAWAGTTPVFSVPSLPFRFGPAARPLMDSGLAARMRITLLRHDIGAHAPAQELAQTGTRPGRPKAAGFAAMVNAHDSSRYAGLVVSRSQATVNGAISAGRYGSVYRPLLLGPPRAGGFGASTDPTLDVGAALMEDRNPRADRIRAGYRDQMRAALTWGTESAPLRSPAFADLEATQAGIESFGPMRPFLLPLLVPAEADVQVANDIVSVKDVDQYAIEKAIDILTNPSSPTRYMCVAVGNFDTHYANNVTYSAMRQGWEFWRVAAALANKADAILGDPNLTIVINTEFGRSPEQSNQASGHWPHGYAVAVIGAEVTPGFTGGWKMDDTGSILNPTEFANTAKNLLYADKRFSPTDLRIAVAHHLGLEDLISTPSAPGTATYPFDLENCGLFAQVEQAGSTLDAREVAIYKAIFTDGV